MIENELKRKFPGAQFHHIDINKIYASGRKGINLQNKALIHNFSQLAYKSAVTSRETMETKHAIRKALQIRGVKKPLTSVERRELEVRKRRVDEAWADVLATNKALPPKLRGRHTR